MQSPKGDEKQGCTSGTGTVINTPPLVSGVLISDVTDKILVQIEEWQNRPLDDVYPVMYIDVIHYFSQRQRSECQKSRFCNSWPYLRRG